MSIQVTWDDLNKELRDTGTIRAGRKSGIKDTHDKPAEEEQEGNVDAYQMITDIQDIASSHIDPLNCQELKSQHISEEEIKGIA